MNDMREIRRHNFNKLSEKFSSQREFSDALDTTPGYVNQLLTGHRPIGEKSARNIESKLGLANFYLDIDLIEDELAELKLPIIPESNVSFTREPPRMIPLISSVSAGRWCEAVDNYSVNDAEDWLPGPHSCSKHTYALRVDGDSMTAPYGKSYPHGSIIYVDPEKPITNFCRVIAKLPDVEQAVFKQYVEDSGKRYLKALNTQYPIIEINDDTRLCGVVIGKYEPE